MKPEITAAAARLKCEPEALAAVIQVESAGSGLGPDGPIIRCEAHLLWKYSQPAAASFHVAGPKPWEGHTFEGKPYHGNQRLEWLAFLTAHAIDADAAVRATSWGAGQVLGEFAALGFPSAQAFIDAQSTSAGQIDTMARFILARPSLVTAIRARDWTTFASGYNGSGKVQDYAATLAAAYAAQH